MAGSKEDTETVRAFFQDMRGRGLGDPLLVVSDGAPGIIRAIEECFPRSARQRCLAHRIAQPCRQGRPTDLWPEFKARASACYQAPSRAIARDARQAAASGRLRHAAAERGRLLRGRLRGLHRPPEASGDASPLDADDDSSGAPLRRRAATAQDQSRTASARSRCSSSCSARSCVRPSAGARLRFTEFELRQIAAVRKDLDAEYEATRSDRASQTRVSSRSAP